MIAGLLGGAASCLIVPDERLSCGDAYVSDAEECDPNDPDRAYLDACRERGYAIDAQCHPETCRILDSEVDCNVCGDGIAVGDEECDGEDLRGETCPSGVDELRCTDDCRLDYDDCPQVCSDGEVTDNEECDPNAACNDADDCRNGTFCNGKLCVRLAEDNQPIDACTDLGDTFVSGKKEFASGDIGGCDPELCVLIREECSFCGDGVLDGELEFEPPGAIDPIPLDPEVCDGEAIGEADLAEWCASRCGDPGDNRLFGCYFDCKDDCSGLDIGFQNPNADNGCCLLKGQDCTDGFKCCDQTSPGNIGLGTCMNGTCI
jgi:hypothetical protein